MQCGAYTHQRLRHINDSPSMSNPPIRPRCMVLKNQPWDLLDERVEQGIDVVAKKKTRTARPSQTNQTCRKLTPYRLVAVLSQLLLGLVVNLCTLLGVG